MRCLNIDTAVHMYFGPDAVPLHSCAQLGQSDAQTEPSLVPEPNEHPCCAGDVRDFHDVVILHEACLKCCPSC